MDNYKKLNYYMLDSTGALLLKAVFSPEKINKILECFLELKPKLNYEKCVCVNKYINFEQIDGINDLVADSAVLEICKNTIGQEFKLDYLTLVEQRREHNCVYSVHGGQHKHFNTFYYHSYPQEHINNPCYTQTGQFTVIIPLTNQNKTTGGFCYLPGSHKSAYHVHSEPLFSQYTNEQLDECFVVPTLNVGDCIMFPESLTHGQSPYNKLQPRYAIVLAYYPVSMRFNKNDAQRNRLFEKCNPDQIKKIYPEICRRSNLHNVQIFNQIKNLSF